VKLASVTTARNRASSAWAPSASLTSCDREAGVQIIVVRAVVAGLARDQRRIARNTNPANAVALIADVVPHRTSVPPANVRQRRRARYSSSSNGGAARTRPAERLNMPNGVDSSSWVLL